jgi:cobalt-zinc-cadmium efflux system protein
MLLACAWIVYEALERLTGEPPPVPGAPVLAVGVLGLLLNLGSAWALVRSGAESMNVRAALLHVVGDALGSVAAIVAAALLLLGIPAADAAASLAVAALVTFGSVRLLREATRVLLELPPPGLDVTQVRDALLAVEGVVEVHDLHAWTLDGRTPMVSAHLVLAEQASFESVCRAATTMLEERFRVAHATVQPERDKLCGTRCGVEAGVV